MTHGGNFTPKPPPVDVEERRQGTLTLARVFAPHDQPAIGTMTAVSSPFRRNLDWIKSLGDIFNMERVGARKRLSGRWLRDGYEAF
jgi:hypothetical protein